MLTLLVAAFGDACTRDDSPTPAKAPDPGVDCAALVRAARAADGCDPELGRLATAVLEAPDEQSCRRQVRRLLDPSPSDANIHSVYEGSVERSEPPLSTAETERLEALSLPGILVVEPDLPLQPGLPSTTVRLGNRELAPGRDGSFLAHVTPGEHDLTIRHAAKESESCVRIARCRRLELTAHGHRLAPHADVTLGPCARPG